jgi:hypothetical protein
VEFTKFHDSLPTAATPNIEPIAGGWRVQNTHYRVDISRSGTILRLWSFRPTKRLLIENSDLYTDNGFGTDRTRYAATNDVETSARFWREGENLHMTFEGQLRGSYRFDLLKPALRYRYDYTLNTGPSFRLSSGVLPTAPPRRQQTFLALLNRIPDMQRLRYWQNGAILSETAISNANQRVGETFNTLQPLPETIEILGADGPLLSLSDLSHGATPVRNVFAHGENFFLSWFDGDTSKDENLAEHIGKWLYVSGVWTPGGATPKAIDVKPNWRDETAEVGVLRDGSFEQTVGLQPRSLRTGALISRPASGGAWETPVGGRLVPEPHRTGQVAAEVNNTTGEYLLYRQALPLSEMPPGSHWRLTAQIKGENIVRGDAVWKTGSLRFGATTTKTEYFSSPDLLGTFDWKSVSAEITVPPGLQRLTIEAGLNGATGKMWIDDVRLEKLP